MKIFNTSLMVFLFMTLACGCSAETKQDSAQVSDHFKPRFSRANMFWELFENGINQQKAGKFDEAILLFKKALKEYAYGKPEQASAMKQIAITYEKLENYAEAIKYYELAADTTMSQKQRKNLLGKTRELKSKIST